MILVLLFQQLLNYQESLLTYKTHCQKQHLAFELLYFASNNI